VAGQAATVTLADFLGGEDPRMEHILGMLAVAAHWGELPAREQKIMLMRFHGDMTQAQIGEQLGMSQINVSRLLAHRPGRRPQPQQARQRAGGLRVGHEQAV